MIHQARPDIQFREAGSRRLLAVCTLLLALVSTAPHAIGAELLMFTRAHCPYCRAWERQIGPIYNKTAEAAVLPLRKIDLDTPDPVPGFIASPVSVTPTFVIVDGNREIGRFEGYSDDMTFWSLLMVHMKKLGPDTAPEKR